MPMTPGEKKAYARGYARAQSRNWPEHRPPTPPDPVIAKLMNALQDLRDVTDGLCATLDESDEFVIQLGPMIDASNEALSGVTKWLKEKEAEQQTG